ncbi:type VI secretion system-associated protein TagF [Yoonia sp. 2307UL14-13]|uniref:type VI secretion system-associated protein TagF n=1 Tax=Yoonia sp. 2307UL14-13 TaxID=3126506 RepID=UPI0030A848B4
MAQGEDHTPALSAGFYGKHPAFGDFVIAGLSQPLCDLLEHWLGQMLPDLRDGVADLWEDHYDSAPIMRIWIGPALTPEGRGFCGMMAPARDKVGRRFPLLAGVEGADIAPPPMHADQTLYDGIDTFLNGYDRDQDDARDMATRFAAAILDDPSPADPLPVTDFWAARPDGDITRLWADVAAAETTRAHATRTYLWRSGSDSSALYATDGLPGAAAFAWMMGAPYTPPTRDAAQ